MLRRTFIQQALGFNLLMPTLLAGCQPQGRPDPTVGDLHSDAQNETPADMPDQPYSTPTPNVTAAPAPQTPLHVKLALAAEARTRVSVVYDPAYVALDYPMGDVADNRGVCADLIIRAYRSVGIDLQQLLHEDMRDHFSAYPRIWGLTRTDTNIDHRRVPNLETFLTRQNARMDHLEAHQLEPGDLVTWRLDNRLPHIGIATTTTDRGGRRIFAQNIGAGPQLEACFDAWPRTAIFRYRPWLVTAVDSDDETDL